MTINKNPRRVKFFKILPFFLLVILLLPSQIMMFRNFRSLDGLIHSERIRQFDQAIRLGHFPVRIAPTMIDEIAYPLFVINYQLPYYASEIVMLFHQDPMLAYKIVMSISFIFSGLFAFLLFRSKGSYWAAIAGMVLYTYLPYRFANLYMRGALGESVSLTFVPLVLYSINKINEGTKTGIFVMALGIFGLITSHTVTLIMFFPFLVVYSILTVKTKHKLLTLIAGFLWGFSLASFQILPSIFEKKYMLLDQSFSNLHNGLFVNIYQLLRIPKDQVNIGSYIQAGLVVMPIIFCTSIISLKKRDWQVLIFIMFALISIFLVTEQSKWFWENLPLIQYVSYPYRFLSVTILSTAFLGSYLIDVLPFKKIIATTLILFVLYTNRHFFIFALPTFQIEPPPNLTTQNESDTVWQNEKTLLARRLITSNPESDISITKKTPLLLSLEATVHEKTEFTVRKIFFPGWQLKINNQVYHPGIKDGLISFSLEPGWWNIDIYYKESRLRQIANYLTLISFLALVFFILKQSNFRKN